MTFRCTKRTRKRSHLAFNTTSPRRLRVEGLEACGRLQYFYHSPSSRLPIRDILNEQGQGKKKEPHIEIGAENYWAPCYQRNNIIPFTKSKEKYLFLMTTCRNRKFKDYYGKKFVVGFIVKKSVGNRNGLRYVKGDIFLYSFKDAMPLEKLRYSTRTRMQKVDEEKTAKLLSHFRSRRNIMEDCIQEIKRLDKDNGTCPRESEKRKCEFYNECKRWH
jgi:hypothetical protein